MLKPIVTAQCLTGRTASSAGTQCLSRLRRAHSASRAYGGHTVPLAPTAGTQCLSRLRRAHSASRAYGGHTVPLAPTASPKEANCEEFCFPLHMGRPYRSKKNHLKTGSHPSASAVKKKALNDRKGPNPGNSPGVGALLLRGKLPSLFVFYFRLARRTASFTPTAGTQCLFAPTAFPKEANCKEFAFRSILEALKKHLANRHGTMLNRTCNVLRAYGVRLQKHLANRHCTVFNRGIARQGGVNARAPGPACRWHRLCSSSRCRSSPRTASSAHRRCRP